MLPKNRRNVFGHKNAYITQVIQAVIFNFIVCLVFRLRNMVQRNAVLFRLPLSLSFRPSEASGEIYQYRKFFQYRKPYAIMRDFSMRRRPIRAGGLVEMT